MAYFIALILAIVAVSLVIFSIALLEFIWCSPNSEFERVLRGAKERRKRNANRLKALKK